MAAQWVCPGCQYKYSTRWCPGCRRGTDDPSQPRLFDESGDDPAEGDDEYAEAFRLDRACSYGPGCYFHRWQRFSVAHPEVLGWLERQTAGFYQRGHRKTGIEYLVNMLRWKALANTDVRRAMDLPDAQEEYAINQNYSAYFARVIQLRRPDLVDMFNRKQSHADCHLDELEANE